MLMASLLKTRLRGYSNNTEIKYTNIIEIQYNKFFHKSTFPADLKKITQGRKIANQCATSLEQMCKESVPL